MRKGVPLTNREKCGRNTYKNAFLQKNQVEEDHLKLLFPEVEAPEALHCEPRLRKCWKVKIPQNKQIVIANLGPTWDGRIWILGMLLILNPRLIYSPYLFI